MRLSKGQTNKKPVAAQRQVSNVPTCTAQPAATTTKAAAWGPLSFANSEIWGREGEGKSLMERKGRAVEKGLINRNWSLDRGGFEPRLKNFLFIGQFSNFSTKHHKCARPFHALWSVRGYPSGNYARGIFIGCKRASHSKRPRLYTGNK